MRINYIRIISLTLPAQTAETEQTESTLSDTDLDQGEPAAVDEQSIPASQTVPP